jgi:signal transduction histidine kinase
MHTGIVLTISVRDEDDAIAVVRQPALFQMFSRIDTPVTRATRGIGLGLYVSRTLVEAMGGSIWVDSDEGKGATFAFTLPVA